MKIWSHWKNYPKNEWRWPNFTPEEMACRGTGKLVVNERAMDMLQSLRDVSGKPFIIRSAYRSPEHNKAVGGAKASKHMEAIAFDISMANHDPHKFEAAAIAAGFKGIGYYTDSNFMHVDARTETLQGGDVDRWGKPFPARHSRFAPEEKPVEEVAPKKREQAAAAVVSAPLVADLVLNGGDTIEKVGGLPVGLQIVVGGAVLALVALFVWRQVRGAKG